MTDEKEKKIKGIILNIGIKEGIKNGNSWKIFEVSIGDIKISTFNEIVVDGFIVGDEVVIEYTEKPNGAFINRNIITIRDLKAYEASAKLTEELSAKFMPEELKVNEEDDEIFILIGDKKYKLNCELVK